MLSSIRESFLYSGPILLRSITLNHLQSKSLSSNFRYLRKSQHGRLLHPLNRFKTTNTNKKPNKKEEDLPFFKIIQAESRDEKRVTQFLRNHFYPEEPLSTGILPEEPPHPEEEQHNVSLIEQGTCLLAVQPCENKMREKKEVLVGAVLAGEKNRGEADRLLTEAERFGSSKYAQILKLIACVERNTNVYDKFKVTRVLHVHVLAVSKLARGQQLGAELMKEIIKLGCDHGFDMVTVDCTSCFSARLCRKIGMKSIYKLSYSNYRNEYGMPIFQPPGPHTKIETFARLLKIKKPDCK